MPPRQSQKLKTEIILGIIGLIVSVIACIGTYFVVPEFRKLLKLDELQLTPTPAVLIPTVALQTKEPSQQSSITDVNNLMEVFPMFVGAKWTYNYSHFIEPTNAINPTSNPELGQFSMTVVVVDTGLSDRVKVIGMKVSGENYFNACVNGGQQLYTGDLDTWFVLDRESMYLACTRADAYAIANDRGTTPDNFVLSTTILPMFKAPLEVGKLWPAFADIPPRNDTAYQWYVESQVDVNIPAGEFKDCYRILLFTLGDSQVRWVCPGTGLVAEEYHHAGAINDYRFELQNYSLITP